MFTASTGKAITVGCDGSEASLEAVRWSAAEAVARKAELHIISCFEVPYGADPLGGVLTAEAVESLKSAAAAVVAHAGRLARAAHPDLVITTDVRRGPATASLVESVGADDLVVVGKSRHGGAAAFWLGSTPRAVLHRSRGPVAVVHGAATRGAPDRIVVGVDGSGSADRALLWACDEADRHGVPLHIVHAWQYVSATIGDLSAEGHDVEGVHGATLLEAAAELARERCGVSVTTELVEKEPVTALADAVRDGDLLVLGTHGRRGITAALVGSTVNGVLEHVAIPVVVVR